MSTGYVDDGIIVSKVSDTSDLPLDAEDNVSGVECQRIMGWTDGKAAEPSISAFNSSI